MPDPANAVIAISSHVGRGSVGNRAMVFALECLGFETWAVPTLVLPYHPGHGPAGRIVVDDDQFAGLIQSLVAGGRAHDVAGIVSGYFATPGQARAVATLVETVKGARPDALYLCDPVIGDGMGLYVAEPVAAAVRDELLPLADIATPNAFECAWLAGVAGAEEPDFPVLARALPPDAVLVTSAPAMMRGHVGNLLVAGRETILFEHPHLAMSAKGTGDLFAGLLLARRLQGHSLARATEMALSSVFSMAAAAAREGKDELPLAAFPSVVTTPVASVAARRLGGLGLQL